VKIAFITEACSAGVGRHVIDAALCHAKAGHEIHVLHSSRRMDDRFACGLNRLAIEGGRVAGFEIARQPGPADLSIINKIRGYLVREGPFDVVHCHSTKAGLIGRLAALGLGARVIYTPHAFFTMSPEHGFPARFAIRLLEFSLAVISDSVICVSQEELAHGEDLGIAPFKLCNIPNGIDAREANRARLHRDATRKRFGLREEDVCIGFVGRLVNQKDPQLLLAAFQRSIAQVPGNVRLVIVGDGPLSSDLAAMVAASHLEDRVLLAGKTDGLEAMSAFDIFALPSRYEGFPYVLLEALAMGLPIISTAVGGVRAMTGDGENGFVVPPSNVDLFARAIVQLSNSKMLRGRMGDFSIRRSARFSLTRMVSETETAYRGSKSAMDLRFATERKTT
jgi:glycosyltransferase involved in cell wall biosynthesis